MFFFLAGISGEMLVFCRICLGFLGKAFLWGNCGVLWGFFWVFVGFLLGFGWGNHGGVCPSLGQHNHGVCHFSFFLTRMWGNHAKVNAGRRSAVCSASEWTALACPRCPNSFPSDRFKHDLLGTKMLLLQGFPLLVFTSTRSSICQGVHVFSPLNVRVGFSPSQVSRESPCE